MSLQIEMKITTFIVRNLLGLIFAVFGLNIFFHFIPIPPPPEGPARDFMRALAASHENFAGLGKDSLMSRASRGHPVTTEAAPSRTTVPDACLAELLSVNGNTIP